MDLDFKAEPEANGYEFGYSCFEELPPAEVYEVSIVVTENVKNQLDTNITIPEMECSLPVPKDKLHRLQLRDAICQKKTKQVKTNTDMSNSYHLDTEGILSKLLQDNEEIFHTIVLPKILIDPVLQLAHNFAGHNGFQWLYMSIR